MTKTHNDSYTKKFSTKKGTTNYLTIYIDKGEALRIVIRVKH